MNQLDYNLWEKIEFDSGPCEGFPQWVCNLRLYDYVVAWEPRILWNRICRVPDHWTEDDYTRHILKPKHCILTPRLYRVSDGRNIILHPDSWWERHFNAVYMNLDDWLTENSLYTYTNPYRVLLCQIPIETHIVKTWSWYSFLPQEKNRESRMITRAQYDGVTKHKTVVDPEDGRLYSGLKKV